MVACNEGCSGEFERGEAGVVRFCGVWNGSSAAHTGLVLDDTLWVNSKSIGTAVDLFDIRLRFCSTLNIARQETRLCHVRQHLPTFLHHASPDMTAAGLRLWQSLKLRPRFITSRGFHSGGDSRWQGSSGNLIPMVIEQTVSCKTACVVSGS